MSTFVHHNPLRGIRRTAYLVLLPAFLCTLFAASGGGHGALAQRRAAGSTPILITLNPAQGVPGDTTSVSACGFIESSTPTFTIAFGDITVARDIPGTPCAGGYYGFGTGTGQAPVQITIPASYGLGPQTIEVRAELVNDPQYVDTTYTVVVANVTSTATATTTATASGTTTPTYSPTSTPSARPTTAATATSTAQVPEPTSTATAIATATVSSTLPPSDTPTPPATSDPTFSPTATQRSVPANVQIATSTVTVTPIRSAPTATVMAALAGPASDTVITFEDIVPDKLNNLIRNPYHDRGVDFIRNPHGGFIDIPYVKGVGPGVAHSGNQVADFSVCNAEVCDSSVYGVFTSNQGHVQMYVGFDTEIETSTERFAQVTLTAYDRSANVVGQSPPTTIVPGVGVHTLLRLDSPSVSIASFLVKLDGQRQVAIDDLSFGPAPATPTVIPSPVLGMPAQGGCQPVPGSRIALTAVRLQSLRLSTAAPHHYKGGQSVLLHAANLPPNADMDLIFDGPRQSIAGAIHRPVGYSPALIRARTDGTGSLLATLRLPADLAYGTGSILLVPRLAPPGQAHSVPLRQWTFGTMPGDPELRITLDGPHGASPANLTVSYQAPVQPGAPAGQTVGQIAPAFGCTRRVDLQSSVDFQSVPEGQGQVNVSDGSGTVLATRTVFLQGGELAAISISFVGSPCPYRIDGLTDKLSGFALGSEEFGVFLSGQPALDSFNAIISQNGRPLDVDKTPLNVRFTLGADLPAPHTVLMHEDSARNGILFIDPLTGVAQCSQGPDGCKPTPSATWFVGNQDVGTLPPGDHLVRVAVGDDPSCATSYTIHVIGTPVIEASWSPQHRAAPLRRNTLYVSGRSFSPLIVHHYANGELSLFGNFEHIHVQQLANGPDCAVAAVFPLYFSGYSTPGSRPDGTFLDVAVDVTPCLDAHPTLPLIVSAVDTGTGAWSNSVTKYPLAHL